MKRIKNTSYNLFEKRININKTPKPDNISQEQKALSKLAFNQLPLQKFAEEIKACNSQEELNAYKTNIEQKLNQFDNLYKKEKACIKPVDLKSIEYLSGLHQETKNKLIESNVFHLIVQKLTIDYFKSNPKINGDKLEVFKVTRKEIASIYKLQLQLTLKETLISYNDILLEYVFNESDQLTVSELLQLIAVVNKHSEGLKYYVKTIKGPGDCYAQRENSNDYIKVELKSGDLENQPLIKLLFKIQNNYLHLEKILFFIDGDKEIINNLMEQNKIQIPDNIELKYINTKEMFADHNYEYPVFKSKNFAFNEIYTSLNKYSFKKEVEQLLEQSIIKDDIDLAKYEDLLKENYSLQWFEV